jgi:predicted Zn-dependent protease
MKKICALLFMLCALCVRAHSAAEIRDTEIEAGLTRLIEPLAKAADIPSGRMKVHIIGDNGFNAFVSNGEDVYIYAGLLMRIRSANALQAVIAHEMGHMLGGHMAQMSARVKAEMTRSLIMYALGVGLMVANPMAGAGLLAGSSSLAKQSMLSFTRDEERLADDAGINLMVKANLDPQGFIEVMEQMREISGEAEARANPNNSNHPLTAERLKNVKEKIKTIKGNRNPEKNDKYDLIRAKLIGYLQNEQHIANQYPAKENSDSAIYARAIGFMRDGNLKDAKTGALTLVSRSPKNPYFYEFLGDIEYRFGHYDDSVGAYEKSLSLLNGNKSQIQTALALVLSERAQPGDAARAIELAKRAILAEPQPLAYWVLAKAYGDDPLADWAFAEYYNLTKNEKNMKKYAKAAQSRLPKNSPEYIKSGDLLK